MHTLPPACLPVCWPGYSAQAPAHPACLSACLPRILLPRLLCQATAHPATCKPACLFAGQATLPRLLHTLPPACLVFAARLLCPGYCTPCHQPACLFAGQATLPRLLHTLPPACLLVCWPGYSAQAPAHPDTCLSACLLARILCPGYSAKATAHPATCQPFCLLAAQATLPRLLNTPPPACLSVCWTGYSAKATAHPATSLPVCLLARLLCPGYCTQCRLPACMLLLAWLLCPATALPPDCLPACVLPSLLHTLHILPACLLGAQATLPRLLNTMPPACLPVCPGYCAQATLPRLMHTLPPACLPARLMARLLCPGDPEHLTACLPACWACCCCPGYSAKAIAPPCHLPACLFDGLATLPSATAHPATCLLGAQATLPRLLHSLQPACLPVCWQGYSAQANAHPATSLPARLLARLFCPANPAA